MQSALNNSITKTREAQMADGGIDQYIVSKVPDDNQLFNFLYIFFAPTTGSHGHGSKKNQIWKEKIERKKKQTTHTKWVPHKYPLYSPRSLIPFSQTLNPISIRQLPTHLLCACFSHRTATHTEKEKGETISNTPKEKNERDRSSKKSKKKKKQRLHTTRINTMFIIHSLHFDYLLNGPSCCAANCSIHCAERRNAIEKKSKIKSSTTK